MPEVTSIEVDEEFDPRPTPTPFGLRGPDGELNKGMVAGIVIAVLLVLLVIGAIATSLGGDSGAKKATWKPTDPLKGLESLTTVDPRSPEMVAMASAMNAWSKFGLTGNISEVESTFDKSGPQYAELLKEQAAIQLKPESGDPAVVTINEMGRAGKADKDIKLRGEVVWTKPGFTPNEFFWDVTMRQQSTGSYLLYNVSTADKNKDKVALTFATPLRLLLAWILRTLCPRKSPNSLQMIKHPHLLNISMFASKSGKSWQPLPWVAMTPTTSNSWLLFIIRSTPKLRIRRPSRTSRARFHLTQTSNQSRKTAL